VKASGERSAVLGPKGGKDPRKKDITGRRRPLLVKKNQTRRGRFKESMKKRRPIPEKQMKLKKARAKKI